MSLDIGRRISNPDTPEYPFPLAFHRYLLSYSPGAKGLKRLLPLLDSFQYGNAKFKDKHIVHLIMDLT